MVLRKRFANAGNIKVTEDDIKKADSMTPSQPRTAPGQLMHMQGLLQNAEQEITALKGQLESAAASTEIALDLIDEVDGRRRQLTDEQFAELTDNLDRNVLLHPIVVRRQANGRYELIAGHNRVAAYRKLGRSTIAARVVAVEDHQVAWLAFFSNLLQPSLPDFEKYWNFRQLQKETGLSHADIAQTAGISRQHVSRILRYDALPEEAKALLQTNPNCLGSAAAQSLSALAEAGNGKEVTEAIRKLVEDPKFTQEQAVSLAKEMAKGPAAAGTASKAEPLVVKTGKKKFCEISVRKNVIGVTLDKGVEDASGWAARIQAFIAAEIAKP